MVEVQLVDGGPAESGEEEASGARDAASDGKATAGCAPSGGGRPTEGAAAADAAGGAAEKRNGEAAADGCG